MPESAGPIPGVGLPASRGGPSHRTADAVPSRNEHDMPDVTGGSGQEHGLLLSWEARCVERGVPSEHCANLSAFHLVAAVESALREGNRRSQLGRAARSWGAQSASPVDVITALSCLREVLGSTQSSGEEDELGSPRTLHLLLDEVMVDAVDALSLIHI